MEFLRKKNLKTELLPDRIFAGPEDRTFFRGNPNFFKNRKTTVTFERIKLESCGRSYSIRFAILYNICTTGTL